MRSAFVFVILAYSMVASANLSTAPDLPLTHCYHWLKEGSQQILTNKYQHAKDNGGELTFYGSTGVAGDGLYCAKTLNGSYSYGDRVVRVDFVADVVFTDGSTKTCGTNGKFYSDDTVCQSKDEDVYLYNASSDWYVIKNENAIQYWSANSDQLIADLKAAENDPIADADSRKHFEDTIVLMQAERAKMSHVAIFNTKSRVDLMKVISNPALLARANPAVLLDQVVGYPRMTAAAKTALINTLVRRTLTEKTSAVPSSFVASIDASAPLQTALRGVIATITAKNIGAFNGEALFALASSKTVTLPAALSDYAWAQHMKTPEGIVSLLSLPEDSPSLKKAVSLYVTPIAFAKAVKSMDADQASAFADLLEKFAAPGKDYSLVFQLIYARMATDKSQEVLDALLTEHKNASLHAAATIPAIFANPFLDGVLDPIGQAALLDSVKDKLPAARVSALTATIAMRAALPNPKHPAYEVFESFKDFEWPTALARQAWMNKLVERSLRERGSENPTNTYRLLEGEFGKVDGDAVGAMDAGAKRVGAAAADSAFYMGIAARLAPSTFMDYAYPALELAAYMQSLKVDTSSDAHPVMAWLALSANPKSREGTAAMSIGATSLDSGLFSAALADMKDEKKMPAASKALIRRMLVYIATPAFTARVKGVQFKIVNGEKMNFDGGVTGAKPDACTFNSTVVGSDDDLTTLFPDVWPAAKAKLAALEDPMCGK